VAAVRADRWYAYWCCWKPVTVAAVRLLLGSAADAWLQLLPATGRLLQRLRSLIASLCALPAGPYKTRVRAFDWAVARQIRFDLSRNLRGLYLLPLLLSASSSSPLHRHSFTLRVVRAGRIRGVLCSLDLQERGKDGRGCGATKGAYLPTAFVICHTRSGILLLPPTRTAPCLMLRARLFFIAILLGGCKHAFSTTPHWHGRGLPSLGRFAGGRRRWRDDEAGAEDAGAAC